MWVEFIAGSRFELAVLRGVFPWALRFPPKKNQYFEIPVGSGMVDQEQPRRLLLFNDYFFIYFIFI